MTKRTKIFIGIALLLFGGMTAYVAARDHSLARQWQAEILRCKEPGVDSDECLRELSRRDIEEARARHGVPRTLEEKQRMAEEGQRQLARNPIRVQEYPEIAGVARDPDRGKIVDGMRPEQIHPRQFFSVNGWYDNIEGVRYSVFAGASTTDYFQGQLIVFQGLDERPYKAKFYPSPSATGPLNIVEVNDGVLKLESISHTYKEIDDSSGQPVVTATHTTPGGDVYYFDIRTRTFQ